MGTSFGEAVDRKTWAELIGAAGTALEHELWCAVVRAVAEAASQQENLPSLDPDESHADFLAQKWLHESLPKDADLTNMLGDNDYFRELGLAWYEKVALSGNACGYTLDAIGDLRALLKDTPYDEKLVTEEVVEEFFREWRTCFLGRVLREAESRRGDGQESERYPEANA